jgi:aldehyde dehydrogenase (NAD+)
MAVVTYEHQYINGEWVTSTNPGKYLEVIDSNTTEVIAQVPDGTAADTHKAVAAARAAFDGWAATPLGRRKELIAKVLANYEEKKPLVVAGLMKELGCTKAFAEGVQANLFTWHAGTALAEVDNIDWVEPQGASTVVKEPIGVVGAITPWNYPLNQIALKIVSNSFPALCRAVSPRQPDS